MGIENCGRKEGMSPLVCPWCGVTFTPYRYNQIYCSKKHQVQAYRKRKYPFERSIKQCAYCGEDFEQFRSYHKCCSTTCADRWLRERTRKEPMPFKERSDVKMRIQLRDTIPKEFLKVIDSVITHKIALPGDLITVRRVLAAARTRHPIKMINTQAAACYYYINEQLAKKGGVLSEFQNCVEGSNSRYDFRSRAIYKVKER